MASYILTIYAFYEKLAELMRTEDLRRFLFYQESQKDVEVLGNFRKVLASQDTTYFADLDAVLVNSPELMVKLLNKDIATRANGNKPRRYQVRDIDRFDVIYAWALENGFSHEEAQKINGRWYEPEPILASNPYIYAMPLMKAIHEHVGPDKLKTLTAREPYLAESNSKWHKRWLPFMDEKNILIRGKDDPRGHVTFKVEEVANEAKVAKYVVVLEDSGLNVEEILKYCDEEDIDNVYCIFLPLGQTQPRFEHPRLLVLRRLPFENQNIESLYEVITSSVAQY